MRFSPRENWRVVLLVVLLVASGLALFVPGVGLGASSAPGDGAASSPTNLQFGIDLEGGARIRAPLVGMTATNVEPGERNVTAIERSVFNQLKNTTARNVSSGDIVFRGRRESNERPALEVRADINRSGFASALDAANISYGRIRPGVTEETRTQTVQVIRNKIDESGLGDRTVQSVFSASDGRNYILVEIPNQNTSGILDLINSRGSVRIDAYHQTEDGEWTNRTVLRREDFARIGIATRTDRLGPHVPVSIESDSASEFQADMVETGVAKPGGTDCGWPGHDGFSGTRGPCLLTVVSGQIVHSAGMSPDLGSSMVAGTWASGDQDAQFVLQTTNLSEARELSINLRAGALPTKLDVSAGSTSFVAPSLAENFKLFSLITGIIAVLAVAGVVFLRYGDPRVAAPMVVTALSEVFMLLGFASAIGLALDLSHVAGFIAVIGTGVDDLIIIADEVLTEGKVGAGRVFQSRFRKAFWIIGAAAATTVIAMGPLAFLQLGDLRGFAIVTIVGVFIGVLVTRPAYGDILRSIMIEEPG
ncbi:MAG: preprotein translocase subunit SecD [Halobacteriales archaeon]